MKSIRFTLKGKPHQVSYDTDRDLYLVGSAYIAPGGELAMSFAEYNSSLLEKYLLLRGTELFDNVQPEKAEELFRTAIDIAMACGDPLPDEWVSRLVRARNAHLVRDNDCHTGPVEVR